LQALTLLPVSNAPRVDTKNVAAGGALPPLSVNGVDMYVPDALLGLAETAKGNARTGLLLIWTTVGWRAACYCVDDGHLNAYSDGSLSSLS
jgi:hypothetical protein